MDVLDIGKIETQTLERGKGARRLYLLHIRTGDPIQIDATSDAIDSVLEVYEEGAREPFVTDDDSGGKLNARLTLKKQGKAQLIVAVRDANDRGGRFELRAGRVETHADADAAPIRIGPPIKAQLTPASPLRDGLNYPYAKYVFAGRAGQRIEIDARSSAFDAGLELRLKDKLVGLDTDSGVGADARLIRELKQDGDYVIWVLSPSKDLGAYEVQVQQVPKPTAPATVVDLPSGTPVSAAFDLTSALRNDQPYALYRVRGLAGQSFRATMEGVDPTHTGVGPVITLEVGTDSAGGYATLEGGKVISPRSTAPGQSTASVSFTFERDGDLLLRATGDLDWIGPYTLTLRPNHPDGSSAAAEDRR